MTKLRPSRQALAKNFAELTKSDGGVEALRKKLKVGNSTVQRLFAGETVQLDTLETVADEYKVQVHQLLMPNLGKGVSFADLDPYEAQLITFYRSIKDNARRLDLIAKANAYATEGEVAPSPANPFGGKKPERVFDDSGPGPLDPKPTRFKAKP